MFIFYINKDLSAPQILQLQNNQWQRFSSPHVLHKRLLLDWQTFGKNSELMLKRISLSLLYQSGTMGHHFIKGTLLCA